MDYLHPTLIHALMERAKVRRFDNDKFVSRKDVIDQLALDRIMKVDKK